MITLAEYLGPWAESKDFTKSRRTNALKLLDACAKLEDMARDDGVSFPTNPSTRSKVSGLTYGGFRPQNCAQGAPRSSHKEGLAVDIYDPLNQIDDWCMKNLPKLVECGIYIEHPSATRHWSHWTIKAPGSGNRVFYP